MQLSNWLNSTKKYEKKYHFLYLYLGQAVEKKKYRNSQQNIQISIFFDDKTLQPSRDIYQIVSTVSFPQNAWNLLDFQHWMHYNDDWHPLDMQEVD